MLYVTVTITVIYFERYSKVLNFCWVFSHQGALPIPSPNDNAYALFKSTFSLLTIVLRNEISMPPGIINIGYNLYFPQIIWLHSWDSGVMLKESIYERINICAINFCGVYFFEFTPQSRKNKFRKVLLFVVIRNSPK